MTAALVTHYVNLFQMLPVNDNELSWLKRKYYYRMYRKVWLILLFGLVGGKLNFLIGVRIVKLPRLLFQMVTHYGCGVEWVWPAGSMFSRTTLFSLPLERLSVHLGLVSLIFTEKEVQLLDTLEH